MEERAEGVEARSLAEGDRGGEPEGRAADDDGDDGRDQGLIKSSVGLGRLPSLLSVCLSVCLSVYLSVCSVHLLSVTGMDLDPVVGCKETIVNVVVVVISCNLTHTSIPRKWEWDMDHTALRKSGSLESKHDA